MCTLCPDQRVEQLCILCKKTALDVLLCWNLHCFAARPRLRRVQYSCVVIERFVLVENDYEYWKEAKHPPSAMSSITAVMLPITADVPKTSHRCVGKDNAPYDHPAQPPLS